MYVYIHIYVYIHTHTLIYVYICMYTHTHAHIVINLILIHTLFVFLLDGICHVFVLCADVLFLFCHLKSLWMFSRHVHNQEFNCKSMESYEAVETARGLFHFVVMPVFFVFCFVSCFYVFVLAL